MLVREMRKYLVGKYPGTAWAKKVDEMSEEQVKAVYLRLIKAVGQRPVVASAPPRYQVAVYTCESCFKEFQSENHELTECRFCGGHVQISYKISTIRKRRADEN